MTLRVKMENPVDIFLNVPDFFIKISMDTTKIALLSYSLVLTKIEFFFSIPVDPKYFFDLFTVHPLFIFVTTPLL